MTEFMTATRRTVLAGAGALAATPALAAVPGGMPGDLAGARESEVARLWREAAALQRQMQPYAGEMTAMSARGLPGWMRLSGAANDLGNRRYGKLIAILKAKPESLDDLAIMAAANRDADIAGGPATWARFQFDAAARDFHRAA